MADIISSFPDDILCYILSFLSTKEVVATSVLSKRWYFVWRSVPSFDFNYNDELIPCGQEEETYNHLLHSVYSFMLWRDLEQPLHRFSLSCRSPFYDSESTQTWVKAAMSRGVEHLCLCLHWVCPSTVFTCETLVVLKLTSITMEDVSFVDLPLLKILHLITVYLPVLSQTLSGCPNLEDLEFNGVCCETIGKVIILPKLIRASICKSILPLEFVKDVQLLFFDLTFLPMFNFQNLVQLELLLHISKHWLHVLEVLKYCIKLQTLVIHISKIYRQLHLTELTGADVGEDVWPLPQTAPACFSSNLKTCRLECYMGSIDEFQFAKYIMENAKHLRTMKICTDSFATHEETLDMIRDLSSLNS